MERFFIRFFFTERISTRENPMDLDHPKLDERGIYYRKCSPLQEVFQFSKQDSGAESFVPYGTTDSEPFVMMHKMMLVMITFHII